MIGVISHTADPHAVGVMRELERGGHRHCLIDTAEFPVSMKLSMQYDGGRRHFELVTAQGKIDALAIRTAWWRRPQPYTLAAGMAPDVAAFSYAECSEAMSGLWAALGATWINPPSHDEVAHHKPYQLKIAGDVGLKIPLTLITTDPNSARQFAVDTARSGTIYKTFLASKECWRETRRINRGEVAMLDLVRHAPVIFQAFVPAVADIRLTVMGDRSFAAAITPAPGAYDLDYRTDMAGAKFEPTVLPDSLMKQIQTLMRRLGLVYGAIDLRHTAEGDYVFLEVNPAGEWRFVEERTAQPMTATFAQVLVDLMR